MIDRSRRRDGIGVVHQRCGALGVSRTGVNFIDKDVFVIKKNLPLIAVAVAFTAFGVTAGAVASQPHMVNALAALQNARSELHAAVANKGGHRERAMELVSQAINQVNAGISYAGN